MTTPYHQLFLTSSIIQETFSIQKNEDINLFIKKRQKNFTEPFSIGKLTFEIQTSIGASIFPEHGNDVDTIMQF